LIAAFKKLFIKSAFCATATPYFTRVLGSASAGSWPSSSAVCLSEDSTDAALSAFRYACATRSQFSARSAVVSCTPGEPKWAPESTRAPFSYSPDCKCKRGGGERGGGGGGGGV
jgi:hypothetical protein